MLTILNNSSSTTIVKKSKFMAFSFLINSKDDVVDIVKKYKAKYCDANHVCYGFISGNNQELYGFSDDGEPSGTAGKQIFSIIKLMKITNALVIVVRYFGGIKLGANGLIKEYRKSTKLVLQKSL